MNTDTSLQSFKESKPFDGAFLRPFVIGIAGGTGSGKSTVAKNIIAAVPGQSAEIINHDSYYHHRPHLSFEDKCRLNYDHPDAYETSLLVEHLNLLRQGIAVDIPIYDFKTHARMSETRRVDPARVLVVEGILTFVDKPLLEMYDLKIFVETDADVRVFRRIRRDIESRGRSFQSVRDQYYATVRPMHLQFVEPSKRWADIIIPEGGENHVALDMIICKVKDVINNSNEYNPDSII